MGQRVANYELEGELGRGGMGVVFLARDLRTGERVALKLLLASKGASEVQRKRFLREAQALTRLEHENVVRVRDSGEQDGTPWLALDFVDGRSLEAHLARGTRFTVPQVLQLGARLARALAHCHAQNVLHRDVKPANVLLRADGTPLLTDFGLTRDLDPRASQSRLTQDGCFLGSPEYWAPEQARGDLALIGPATDVYGLGATLHTLLTGAPLHAGESLPQLMRAAERAPEPPSRQRPGVPAALDALVLRALAPEPVARPDARELASALEALAARPVSPGRQVRRRGALAVATLAACSVGACSVGVWIARRPAATVAGPVAPLRSASTPSDDSYAADLQRARKGLRSGSFPSVAELDALVSRASPESLAEAELLNAELCWAREDYDKAMRCCQAVLLATPDEGQAAFARGLSAAITGELEVARRELDRAVALRAKDPEPLLARASTRRSQGETKLAWADYARVLELDPGFALASYQRAGMHLEQHDLASGLRDLELALAINPDFALALMVRATLRAEQGDGPAARVDLDRSIALDPSIAEAWANRARLRERDNDPDGALADYSRALELNPRLWQAYARRGDLHLARSALREAIRDYGRVLELGGDRVAALGQRGIARRRLGDLEGAIADQTAVLAIDPTVVNARVNRALARYAKHDARGALEDLTRALELEPTNPQAPAIRQEIARLRAELGG